MSAENVTNVHAGKTEAEAVAEIVNKRPVLVEIGTVYEQDGSENTVRCVLVPPSMQLASIKKELDLYRDAPERREGTARFTDLKSLIAHANRFKDEDSTIWLDRGQKSPALVSVLDYHRKGAEGSPRFGRHRGMYAFPFSDEWQAWIGKTGQAMQDDDFARWLEDHLIDVAEPESALAGAKEFSKLSGAGYASPAKLLELSKGLDVHVGQRIKEHRNLANGERTLHFDESHAGSDGQPLKVPGAFLLTIPVFRAGAAYQLPCRLRYRASPSGVTWSYEVHRGQATLDHAIEEACELVRKETSLPVYDGTPES